MFRGPRAICPVDTAQLTRPFETTGERNTTSQQVLIESRSWRNGRWIGKRLLLIAGTLLFCASIRPAAADESIPIPNADFNEGESLPSHWRLADGQGRWVDDDILEVTGDGTDSGYWRCDYPFVPGALYRFEARGRGTPTGGSAVLGPVFANRDYRTPSHDWTWVGHIFRTPDQLAESYLRLGHWRAAGTIQYDAVRLQRVEPIHLRWGEAGLIELGEGEQIRAGRYEFSGMFQHESSNYHRPLQSATASFNSDRWVLGTGQQITYRFRVSQASFRDAHLSFHVNYFVRGGCSAQVRSDNSDWLDLATQTRIGTSDVDLPADLFPTESLWLRLKALAEDTSLQVNRIAFSGGLDQAPADAVGRTLFANVDQGRSPLQVTQMALVSDGSSEARPSQLEVEFQNPTNEMVKAIVQSHVVPSSQIAQRDTVEVPPNAAIQVTRSLTAEAPGDHQLRLEVTSAGDRSDSSKWTIPFELPDFYRTDYGAMLPCDDVSGLKVWWCPATHKVPQQRAVPVRESAAAKLSAAKNDFEAVQIVLHAERDLQDLRVQVSDLVGPHGARLPADQVSILRVAYHMVRHPTDRTGVVDLWPDALPPLTSPLDLAAGRNQPLWVLVHVPSDTIAGDYRGQIELRNREVTLAIPIELHVWDFALPQTNHLETAFGLSLGNIVRYHGLQTETQKRQVWDQYLQCFADHRISPYDPVPLDPIRVEFRSDTNPPRADVDFSAFEPAFRRMLRNSTSPAIDYRFRGWAEVPFTHARNRESANSALKHRSIRRCSPAMRVNWSVSFAIMDGWIGHTFTGLMNRTRRTTHLSPTVSPDCSGRRPSYGGC